MNKLEEYRNKMAQIDMQLTELLLQRIQLSKKIGIYKKEKNIPIFQAKREEEVLTTVSSFCQNEEEKKWIKQIFQELMNWSKEVQR